MSDSREVMGTGLLFFLLGAAVGAAVVALTTPKTGNDLRADLRNLGERIRDKAGRMGSRMDACAEDVAEEAVKG